MYNSLKDKNTKEGVASGIVGFIFYILGIIILVISTSLIAIFLSLIAVSIILFGLIRHFIMLLRVKY